jgi:hypothetical protein
MLPVAVEPLSPEAAGLDPLQMTDAGEGIARIDWSSRTIVAMRTGGPALNAVAHRHRDLASIQLVHLGQPMLVDPGHACYRNITRPLDVASEAHNTCTFETADAPPALLEQALPPNRGRRGTQLGPAINAGMTRRLIKRLDDVSVMAGDAGSAYPDPVQRFERITVVCGDHCIFILDQINSDVPIYPSWHWVLDNRDGQLELNVAAADRIVARRPGVGMKLFCQADTGPPHLTHAVCHDRYHPIPGGPGEGRPGSATRLTWKHAEASQEISGIHAIAIDRSGRIGEWHLRCVDGRIGLESPGCATHWSVQADTAGWKLDETNSGRSYVIRRTVDNTNAVDLSFERLG